MEQDINYLISRLGKIEGFGDTGEKLLGVVKDKKVEPPAEEAKEEERAEGENGKASSGGDTSEGSPKPDEKSGGEESKDDGPG